MKNARYLLLIVSLEALLGVLGFYLYLRFNVEHAYLGVADDNNRVNAMIVWKWQLPFDYVGARLQVETFYGRRLLDIPLVDGREALEDIKLEFRNIRIEGSKVLLDCRHDFYTGPDEIPFQLAQ